MQMIRTTITMPKNIHNYLKRQALEENKSFNTLMLEKVINGERVDVKKSLREIRKITKGISFKGIDYKELTHYGHKY